jgi:prophage antirepressor-like protein
MNQLQIFNHQMFGDVRFIEIDNKPHAVGNDVAKALGYSRPHEAISTHCKGAVSCRILTNGGEQTVKVIPEGDIYRLIVKAADQNKNSEIRKKAEEFEKWIFDVVLPTIRKTGGYVSNDDLFIQTYLPFADDQTKILFRGVLETVRKQNEQIASMKPKAEAHDRFISGENYQSMNVVAKALGTGRNRLFEFLRKEKILMSNNVPYQEYIDRGYFVVKERPIKMGDQIINKPQTYVTAKGVSFIDSILNRQKGA